MLINFTFENFRSFRDAAEFSMLASEEEGLECDTLLPVSDVKLLPLTAVYGGNASGKTNFVRALYELRALVCDGKVKNYMPFRLDDVSRNSPTVFTIEISTGNEEWRYSLSIQGQQVVEESLYCLSSELPVYSRNEKGSVEFDEAFFERKSKEEIKTANDIAGTTAQSDVLLTTLHKLQGIMVDFAAVASKIHAWFDDVLIIKPAWLPGVVPAVIYHTNEFSPYLRDAGTGISNLSVKSLPLRAEGNQEQVLNFIKQTIAENEIRSIGDVVLQKKEGELISLKCVAQHVLASGRVETFDLSEESDGTNSFINLLPVLHNPKKTPRVFVIDELDRSLHTKLSRKLIERHLDMARSGVTQQLIFTTHDVMLMDKDLLRQDEVWLVDRYEEGTSELTSYIEYEGDNDNMRRTYLQGRIGGIPSLYL